MLLLDGEAVALLATARPSSTSFLTLLIQARPQKHPVSLGCHGPLLSLKLLRDSVHVKHRAPVSSTTRHSLSLWGSSGPHLLRLLQILLLPQTNMSLDDSPSPRGKTGGRGRAEALVSRQRPPTPDPGRELPPSGLFCPSWGPACGPRGAPRRGRGPHLWGLKEPCLWISSEAVGLGSRRHAGPGASSREGARFSGRRDAGSRPPGAVCSLMLATRSCSGLAASSVPRATSYLEVFTEAQGGNCELKSCSCADQPHSRGFPRTFSSYQATRPTFSENCANATGVGVTSHLALWKLCTRSAEVG